MMYPCNFILALAALSVLFSGDSQAGPACKLGNIAVPDLRVRTLRPADFAALHAQLTPTGPGEQWREIPWESDLNAAREKARRQKKPLLLWVMDGHPLGCT